MVGLWSRWRLFSLFIKYQCLSLLSPLSVSPSITVVVCVSVSSNAVEMKEKENEREDLREPRGQAKANYEEAGGADCTHHRYILCLPVVGHTSQTQ